MIVALIPARSGSKRVKDKNIRPLGGYPLMAWSIACAKMCDSIGGAFVSSESDKYLEMAEKYNARTIKRPAHLSQDGSTDWDYLNHALGVWKTLPDFIVLLRPSTPLREPNKIDGRCQYNYMLRETYWSSFRTHEWIHDLQEKRPDGYCDILKPDQILLGDDIWGKSILWEKQNPVGEIDEEEDFDYIEWRLAKYGSPILDYLKTNYSNLE